MRPAGLRNPSYEDRQKRLEPKPERPHVILAARPAARLSVNSEFRRASVRKPENVLREKPVKPVSRSLASLSAVPAERKIFEPPVTKLRPSATKRNGIIDQRPVVSPVHEVRAMDNKRCKERPTKTKGSGGSKAFVPWCERRG